MTDTKTSKNKYYILGAIFFIGLVIGLIFTLKPHNQETTTTHQNPNTATETQQVAATLTTQNEEIQPITLSTSEVVTSELDENTVLFDTKSDMTIQPIDPETDPANKIDNIEES